MNGLKAKLLFVALVPLASLILVLLSWLQGALLPGPFSLAAPQPIAQSLLGLQPPLARFVGIALALAGFGLLVALWAAAKIQTWVIAPAAKLAKHLQTLTQQEAAQSWSELESQIAVLGRELHQQQQWAAALSQGRLLDQAAELNPQLPLSRALLQLSHNLEARVLQVKALAEGPLGMEPGATLPQDPLAHAVDHLVLHVQPLVQGLAEGAQRLLQGSEVLASIGQELNATTQEIEGEAKRVASLGEGFFAKVMQLSFAAQGIAASSKAMALHAQSTDQTLAQVAGHTSEMEQAIRQVAAQAQTSHQRAEQAQAQSQETAANMVGFHQAASQIKEINRMIGEIAHQTQMLSLNAAIEAASAGAAGRGFAVVAGETKTLALRTAAATTEINKRIAHMEAQTQACIKGVQSLGSSIDQVQAANSAIAQATSRQWEQAQGVSQGMQTATQKGVAIARLTQELAQQVAEVAATSQGLVKGTQMISANLIEIHQACGESHLGLRRLEAEGELLAHLARFWQGECQSFREAQEAAPGMLVIAALEPLPKETRGSRRPSLTQPALTQDDLNRWGQLSGEVATDLAGPQPQRLLILVGEHSA